MSEKKIPLVGLIIVTYNAEAFIEQCLQSVEKNDYLHKICIVIDNASIDNTINIVHKKYPSIHLIKNKKNHGFGKAVNQGIRYFLRKTKVSYLILLNPDTHVQKSLISDLVLFMESKSNTAIAGPVITYMAYKHKIWFAGGYLNKLFMYTRHIYMNKKLDQVNLSNKSVDFITGACMIIRTNTLKKIGLFPEDYFLYFEDVEFCQKAVKIGYSCQLLAKPLVRHAVSSSSGHSGTNDLTKIRAYYYARNPLLYIKRNVLGIRKITNYFGQFIIRFPYYALTLIQQKNLPSLIYYLRGLHDGIYIGSPQKKGA